MAAPEASPNAGVKFLLASDVEYEAWTVYIAKLDVLGTLGSSPNQAKY